jgi:hypothetical protein
LLVDSAITFSSCARVTFSMPQILSMWSRTAFDAGRSA